MNHFYDFVNEKTYVDGLKNKLIDLMLNLCNFLLQFQSVVG